MEGLGTQRPSTSVIRNRPEKGRRVNRCKGAGSVRAKAKQPTHNDTWMISCLQLVKGPPIRVAALGTFTLLRPGLPRTRVDDSGARSEVFGQP